MSAAEETKAVIDVAVNYTKQLVDALTPIASKAYEIGLLTLQIDAAQNILIGLMGAAYLYFFLRLFTKKILPVMAGKESEVWWEIPAMVFGGVAAITGTVVVIVNIFNVWVWVKLFSPQLWLAHMAVEKIIK